MRRTGQERAIPEKRLGILAMQFRGTKDPVCRREIADQYSHTVSELIRSGSWKDIPTLEDQLPDEWMSEEFYKHWSLTPLRPTGRIDGIDSPDPR